MKESIWGSEQQKHVNTLERGFILKSEVPQFEAKSGN